ncbi:MAG: hypothetical protein IPP19_10585 [Verrucomicrobia bacterium]|nr:hypothetical protein [Verrucomicrobiota bacterium]
MSISDLINLASGHQLVLVAVFVLIPLLAWVVGRLHRPGEGRTTPWKYAYAVLVYLTCVPGMFASVITAHSLFFSRENLLHVSLPVYFLPIFSMVVTLMFIRRAVSFDDVPGFDRLSGLMTLVGVSFAIALAIQKTNIFVFFGGSIDRLFVLAIAVFALLKWGSAMLFRRREDPKPERPKFPGA